MGEPGPQPSVLLAVSALLGAPVEVDTLLARLVELIREALEADRATLFLIDRERGELYSRAAHLPEIDEIRLALGQGIAGHVAQTGQTVVVPSAQTDHRFAGEVDQSTGYRTTSLLAVPVFGRDRTAGVDGRSVVGVLEVLNKRSAAQFDDRDLGALVGLATQVGEALAITHLDDSGERPARYNRIVGASPAISAVYEIMASAAQTDATVLVLGESGTGKEMVARALHANGARAAGPFIKVDCTAIPETLFEAELFGHEKGAFTGAERLVKGKCELAAGGTLFLDEIGDMPLPLQAKLLRFVQDREFERIGGREVHKADVRIIAATHCDLERAVERGQFRRDLYYRIKVVGIALPPLRQRGPDDVAQLARHFLRLFSRRHGCPARAFSPEAIAALTQHTWPGNIRELEHCIESAVVLCREPIIDMGHLPMPSRQAAEDAALPQLGERSQKGHDSLQGRTLAEVERGHIARTLEHEQGNRTRAAQVLGIGRNTLARKIKHYDLD